MSAEQISPAFAEFENSAELDLHDVLALQSLMMGDIRREAIQLGRRVYSSENPRTHAFVVLRNSGNDTRNGEVDSILSVRSRKLGDFCYRTWALGVSFLEYEQTEDSRLENLRTLFQFRWDGNVARGRRLESRVMGNEKVYDVQLNGMPVLPGTESVHKTVKSPLGADELGFVASHALEVISTATPRMRQFIDRIVEEKIFVAA